MATMKQVADRAGVSTSTVSHVINNTRIVSADARARVLAIIAELRYIPSAVARSLKNDRTQIVGVMIPNNAIPCFAELIQGIEDATFEVGFNIILCNAYDNPVKQAAYLRLLMEKRIDGLVLIAGACEDELSLLLQGPPLPLVLVERPLAGVQADFIGSDQEAGAYLATSHLIKLGHRDIACVSGPDSMPPCAARAAGYLRALKAAGLAPRAEYMVRGEFTSAGGFATFRQLLALKHRPSAIFAGSDLMAIGGMCAAGEARVRIPHELSVIGYDDIALAAYTSPRLTTIVQPKYELGQRAAKVLIERIGGARGPLRSELLATTLAVRQSTAPPLSPSCR